MAESISDAIKRQLTPIYGSELSIMDLLTRYWEDNGGIFLTGVARKNFFAGFGATGESVSDIELDFWSRIGVSEEEPGPTVPPEFRSFSQADANLSGITTISKPAGVVEGDLLIAVWYGSVPSAVPSGFAEIPGYTEPSLTCYYKVAGAAEPATYDFSFDTIQDRRTIVMCAYSGVDTAAPFDAVVSQTTSPDWDGITTTQDNCLVVAHAGRYSLAANIAPPEMTERYNITDIAAPGVMVYVGADEVKLTAGALGLRSWETACGGGMFSLAPA